MKAVTIVSAMICEDIRPEVNGKYSLNGVFGTDMKLQTIPGTIVLGMFAVIRNHITGETDGEFRVVDARKKTLVKAVVQANFDTVGGSLLPVGPFPLAIHEPTTLKFQLRLGDDRWQTAAEIGVTEDPTIEGVARRAIIHRADE
jgi:hypothetical protein